jgi:hypothetical protein
MWSLSRSPRLDLVVKNRTWRGNFESLPGDQGKLILSHASAIFQVRRSSVNAASLPADFFLPIRPIVPRLALPQKDFLHSSNWELDLDSTDFPNSPLGRSQELNDWTHPHLRLDETMTALPTVNPGDQAWWHCDGVHSVESSHKGTSASSVLYIPSVPLTVGNARYVKEQLVSYRAFIPPPDFPGGAGESDFRGQAVDQDILSDGGRQGMGIASFHPENAKSDAEWELMRQW